MYMIMFYFENAEIKTNKQTNNTHESLKLRQILMFQIYSLKWLLTLAAWYIGL